ncbi:MAG: octaprenyl diphosphate synthase, partial [Litorivicinus sp.]
LGDDLAEGKVTLPILIAKAQLPAAKARWLDMQFTRANRDALDDVIDALAECNALEQTLARAGELAQQAIDQLDALPAGPYRDHLATLANIAAKRDH